MNEEGRRRLTFESRSSRWLQRALFTVLGAALIVLAFFFITVALIAGALLAIVIALRFWWLMRRLRATHKASAPLEGQYTIVEHADAETLRR